MGVGGFLRREFSFIEGNYRVLIISWMIMDLAMELPVPYYQQYVQALGGDQFPLALGVIGFANFIGMAVVALPGGFLADRYGRRWLIATMTFGIGISYVLFALAPTWHLILIGTIIHSLCLIYQPALFAMVQDSLPAERRGIGSSLIQMIHGTFNTPGPVLAGFFFWAFGLITGMRIMYTIVTILFLIAAIWRLQLKETVQSTEKMRFRYFISSYPRAVKESFEVWKHIPRTMAWLFLVQVVFMFANALTNVINARYATEYLGIPNELWFLTFIPLLLTMIAASIPIGKAVDKFGPKKPLIFGPVVLAGGALLFVHGDFFTVMASMILFGLVHLLIMSSAMALSAELVGPENRGKVRGSLNFVGYIFTGIGMLLGNYLFNLHPPLPFYMTIALAIPIVLMILFRVHEPQKQSTTS